MKWDDLQPGDVLIGVSPNSVWLLTNKNIDTETWLCLATSKHSTSSRLIGANNDASSFQVFRNGEEVT